MIRKRRGNHGFPPLLLCAVRPRRPHPRQLTAGTPPFARGGRSAKGGAPGSSRPTPGRPTACSVMQKRPETLPVPGLLHYLSTAP